MAKMHPKRLEASHKVAEFLSAYDSHTEHEGSYDAMATYEMHLDAIVDLVAKGLEKEAGSGRSHDSG